jgi:hypothetical protein
LQHYPAADAARLALTPESVPEISCIFFPFRLHPA